MPCWTISSGMTSQPALAVALALCAPSIWKIPAPAMTRLASAASTNDRYMLMLRYSTLYCGSWCAPLTPSSAKRTATSGPATPET